MSHLNTHAYAFLKNNRVISSTVFENHDDQDLIESVKQRLDADQYVDCCEVGVIPGTYYTWENGEFIAPTEDWLYENGIISETTQMLRLRQEAEEYYFATLNEL
jgi:hypothetical protein